MGSIVRRTQLGGYLISFGGSFLKCRSEHLGEPRLAELNRNLNEVTADPPGRIEPIRACKVEHAEVGVLLQVVGKIDDDHPPLVLVAKGQSAA